MSNDINVKEFHWLMDMIQSVDVGLIVMDNQYRVKVWNSFMENHSSLSSEDVRGKDLFSLFSNTSTSWMKKKVDSVFMLNNRAFSTWEQRPYLFRFNNYRPITGTETFMYQNISVIPLCSTTGEVESVCMIIYDVTDIASQRKELHVANEQLQSLSRTDAMTGLNNRGYWQECLNNEFKRYCRNPQPRTLVIFDIDHFKQINDTYGHHIGDEIIKGVSTIFLNTQRDTDISGRYGGEEFVIILTNVKENSAKIFSERLRKKVEEYVYIDEENELEVKVTISLGLAELNEEDKDPTEWLNRADTALYEAKNAGRNQSVLYSDIKDKLREQD